MQSPPEQVSELNIKEPARKPQWLVIDNRIWHLSGLHPIILNLRMKGMEHGVPLQVDTHMKPWGGDPDNINYLPIPAQTPIYRMELRYALVAEDGEMESLPLHPQVFSIRNVDGGTYSPNRFPDYHLLLTSHEGFLLIAMKIAVVFASGRISFPSDYCE